MVGIVFGEGELETDVGVHVAVGDVMGDLADGPATVAVRRVELRVGESADGLAEAGGSLLDVVEVLFFLVGGDGAGVREFAYGETRVGHEGLDEWRGAEGAEKGVRRQASGKASSLNARFALDWRGSRFAVVFFRVPSPPLLSGFRGPCLSFRAALFLLLCDGLFPCLFGSSLQDGSDQHCYQR